MPDSVSRRRFLQTGALAAGAVALPSTSLGATLAPARTRGTGVRRRIAPVGTGIRGTGMWGRDLLAAHGDVVEFVGLCDINPGRLEYGKRFIGAECPTYSDFDRMLSESGPETVIVTTMDSTHDTLIVKALDAGLDVVTEKPMTTDEARCQRILDASDRARGRLIVGHNYRYSPHREFMKRQLMEERIGRLTSVDFHWYLDINHGADYFRRWHGKERFSGGLYVHKASHHFDLLNWWIDSEPEEVFAHADLTYYGRNNDFRGSRCTGCSHADRCSHFWDITRDGHLVGLYVDNEQYDGYLRDGCVWAEDIDIFDRMTAGFRYANGVTVSYSCTTFSPYEGYRIAFNGTKGRMEAWIHERQPWPSPEADEIRITDNFGYSQIVQVPFSTSGHGGADARVLDRIFAHPDAPDPTGLVADVRQGAMAVLAGIGARKSAHDGRPVRIADLTSLVPQAERPARV